MSPTANQAIGPAPGLNEMGSSRRWGPDGHGFHPSMSIILMNEQAASLVLVWVLSALLFGALGEWVAGRKNRDGFEGFFLGLLFGPVGMLVEAALPDGPAPGFVGNSMFVRAIVIALLSALIPVAVAWRLVWP
jgi:uncharacterized membrane protein YeaQ/YmgE (transglycosylase-associated protein family)